MASIRCQLVSSQLAGPRAHLEQLTQLLEAPQNYWKAQTPLPLKPVASSRIDAAGGVISDLSFAPNVTTRHVETLFVLMAARMPGLSIRVAIDGSPEGITGMRLVRGKLEVERAGDAGRKTWSRIPHHSTLIGSK
jgi:hypothetical protein